MASKQATFLLVATFLFLLCLRTQAVRLEPRTNSHQPQGVEEDMKSATSGHHQEMKGVEMEMAQEQEMKECEGGEGVEECLMRRTLVAHTDYIYTQGKHN